jgi:hypothetical protein
MQKAAGSQRKERVTISLSPDSAAYVRRFSAQEHAHISTVFERMIKDFRRTRELAQLNASIASFYDSLPDPIVQEQAAWGAVGAAGLAETYEPEIKPVAPELPHAGD